MTSIRFEEHTRVFLKQAAPHTTVVVPLGSIEQHADHLPVCVDTAVVHALAGKAVARAAEQVSVLVTPTLPFGYSHHHFPFGGTLSISGETYVNVLRDLGRSLVRDGFSRIIFLSGHGGNAPSLVSVVDRLSYEDGAEAHIAALSYWDLTADLVTPLGLQPFPGHAGRYETSVVMALRPELVDTEQLPEPGSVTNGVPNPPPGVSMRRPGLWEDGDGRTDDASGASAELGHEALELIAERLAQFIVDFHRGC